MEPFVHKQSTPKENRINCIVSNLCLLLFVFTVDTQICCNEPMTVEHCTSLI